MTDKYREFAERQMADFQAGNIGHDDLICLSHPEFGILNPYLDTDGINPVDPVEAYGTEPFDEWKREVDARLEASS